MPRRSDGTRIATQVRMPADVDLHARPAADLVRVASRFAANVRIAAEGREADAKSVLSILALGARRGAELELRAEGPDALEAIESLARCLQGFSEQHDQVGSRE